MLKSFAGGRFYGRTWGDAPPTVLALHGWRRDHRDFEAAFGTLEPGQGAAAVDLPGFGATPPPDEAWGSEDYAEALLPVLDELAGGPLVVVGHSFGGRVALRLARTAPERIERLVLTGVPLLPRAGGPRRPPAAFRLARRLHRMGLVGEKRMDALRDRYGSADYRASSGVMRAVLVRSVSESYEEDLAALTVPVTLVWGERDTDVPLDVARRASDLLGGAPLVVVPGAGHLLPTDAPDALRSQVAPGPTARPA